MNLSNFYVRTLVELLGCTAVTGQPFLQDSLVGVCREAVSFRAANAVPLSRAFAGAPPEGLVAVSGLGGLRLGQLRVKGLDHLRAAMQSAGS